MFVRYYVAVSLDGFIAPDDGSVGWLEGFSSPGAEQEFKDFNAGISALVMGRATYDQMRSFGPWAHAHQHTVVLSHRPLHDAPERVYRVTSARQSLEHLRELKPAGDVWLVGGGEIAGQFDAAGLIDRLELFTIPVELRSGVRLFGEGGAARRWTHVETTVSAAGLARSVYAR